MSVFMGNHLIVIMTLSEASAPAARSSPVTIVPYYLYTAEQIFSVTVIKETSHYAPAPDGGRAGARGLSSL